MRVLIIDDEPNMRSSLAEYLSLEGLSSVAAASAEEARALLEREVVDACVVDLRLPGESGQSFLEWLVRSGPGAPAIMISAHGGVKEAVAALKAGAADYLVKPFDPDELVLKLKKAVEDLRMRARLELGKKEPRGAAPAWIGESEPMRDMKRLALKAASSSATVLITGESGTGKEVAARFIHAASPRAAGPFVPVNVAALPELLLESELFGYEKGAFTGASSRKSGIFELAAGGTLFLDEIGEIPAQVQVKLLRAIQERTIMRLGGQRPLPVDVRIIAATNRSLEDDIRSGRFREDLYYRINVIRIELPPLRDRPSDIPSLAEHFVERHARETGRKGLRLSPAAASFLAGYSFPGNVRELENLIERAVILSEGETLEQGDFRFLPVLKPPAPDAALRKPSAPAGAIDLKAAEREAIVSALRKNGGHRERSASVLGCTRRTLLTKMKEYGIGDAEWS